MITGDRISDRQVLIRPAKLCRNSKSATNIVMPVKTGIQNMLKILDSVSRFACTERVT